MQGLTSPPIRDIHEVLRTHWGYSSFRPDQETIIRDVLASRDTLALLPTGGGKSLCFQVPALAMGRLCLVISPLIALMHDQVSRLKAQGMTAGALVSGMHRSEMETMLENACLGRLSFLYVSPERLGSEMFRARLGRLPVGLIAVDEAHCISQWGHDLRPAYRKVRELREALPHTPVLALTASATSEVVADIMEQLAFRTPHVIRASFQRPELVLWVSRGEDKHGRLLRILNHQRGSAIVYMRDRRGTVRLAHFLAHHGIGAEAYHAGMPAEERDRIQKAWTTGALRCVVATNAFGMGIDKSDVRTVVHMDLPPDLESYYQEAGRGGRDKQTAHAFMLLASGDEERLRERTQASFPQLADVRKVYQAFADSHGIAIGSGTMETYPMELSDLATRAGLSASITAHALRALELDGRIVISEGLREPSRVFIRAAPTTVHHLRVTDGRRGPLLEALLRLYGGLYEEAAAVDELRIARLCEWQTSTVTSRLRDLDRMEVISYRPRNERPSITLLQQRADAQRLALDPKALAFRKQRAEQRMEAMLRFAQERDECRSIALLRYFHETPGAPCGRCDVCTGNARRYATGALPTSTRTVAKDIDEMRWDLDDHAS